MTRDLSKLTNLRPYINPTFELSSQPARQDVPIFLAVVDALGWPAGPARLDRDRQGRRGGDVR
jgi:hypothetical protein